MTALLSDWRQRPALLLGGLGLVSGVLSATLGFDFEPAWLKPVGTVLFLDAGMIPIGVFFGVAIALGVWMATSRPWWIAPVLLVTTMYSWSAAIHTAIRLQTHRGETWRLILASLLAGAIGALLTHLGCALFAAELRRPSRIALTVAAGAIVGLLFYLGERSYLSPRVLFIVWQPAVAYCIGHALAQPSARV